MLCNPVTFNNRKTSDSADLPPLFVEDRKVFIAKVKANIVTFDSIIQWNHNSSNCTRKKVSYQRLSAVEILTKTFSLQSNPVVWEKAGVQNLPLYNGA